MPEPDAPEADLFEQEQPVGPEPAVEPGGPGDLAGDVPEADALEQAQPVGPEPRVPAPARRLDIPEADALEQAEEVVDDEEDWGRG